jgi:hypothetical protein
LKSEKVPLYPRAFLFLYANSSLNAYIGHIPYFRCFGEVPDAGDKDTAGVQSGECIQKKRVAALSVK